MRDRFQQRHRYRDGGHCRRHATGAHPGRCPRLSKKILLANKEALVMSGQLFMDAVQEHGATLLPIDSEHNAIFQSLPQSYARSPKAVGVAKILLTASGGPFLKRDVATLEHVTPAEACKHPNWEMGRKISVDSATMMNKGLEVIEAHWLFGAPCRADRSGDPSAKRDPFDGVVHGRLGHRGAGQSRHAHPDRQRARLPGTDQNRAWPSST
ncbi:hypothetical protein LP419_37265 [Massilia sp. H-1]|nr:hypothetical protein LP419_37265 [Massilia sp. H-1]